MGQRNGSVMAVLSVVIITTSAVESAVAAESCVVQLLPLDAEPTPYATDGDSFAAGRQGSIRPYALVVHLPPGRELQRADCTVRHGFVVERPHQRKARARARRSALSRMTIGVVTRGIDENLGIASALVGELVLGRKAADAAHARRGVKITLRAKQIEQHASYAVSIVELETASLTRVDCKRIVTRRARFAADGAQRASKGPTCSRDRAASALVPLGDEPGLGHEALEELLRGRYVFPDPVD